jgi:FolB domain-containing protein
MDKVFIKNLHVKAIIGVDQQERETPQDIVINTTVQTDTSTASKTDNISDCIDYANLTDKIRHLATNAKRFTVEALAEDIAHLCLSDPRIKKVSIRIEKTGAVKDTDSVGVEIERDRS